MMFESEPRWAHGILHEENVLKLLNGGTHMQRSIHTVWLAQTKLLLLVAVLFYLSFDSCVYGYNTAASQGITNISEKKSSLSTLKWS
jgi:hypothetical protein